MQVGASWVDVANVHSSVRLRHSLKVCLEKGRKKKKAGGGRG